MQVSLLAVDYDNTVPKARPFPADWTPISIWQLETLNPLAFSELDVTVRYPYTSGAPETEYRLVRWNGSAWEDIGDSPNTTAHTLSTATALTSFPAYIAVVRDTSQGGSSMLLDRIGAGLDEPAAFRAPPAEAEWLEALQEAGRLEEYQAACGQ